MPRRSVMRTFVSCAFWIRVVVGRIGVGSIVVGSIVGSGVGLNGCASDLQQETAVQHIPLAPPLDQPSAQLSSLVWWGEMLVLVPQYPTFAADGDTAQAHFYGIPRDALRRAIQRPDAPGPAIEPMPLKIEGVRLLRGDGYQGIEAVVVSGERWYAAVEAGRADAPGMQAYLASGRVASPTPSGSPPFTIASIAEVDVPTDLANMAYETLVVHRDTLIALHEANGARVHPDAEARRFDDRLVEQAPLPMTPVEYRVTDATAADSTGRFWVMNYLYPGERDLLDPAVDDVAREHGVGVSHRDRTVVERLVELQVTPSGIRRTSASPVWLELAPETGHNWEGVVRFGDGFLLVTDTFPETILAYVSPPKSGPSSPTSER